MNEISLAEAVELAAALGPKAVVLLPPDEATQRDVDLANAELDRRGCPARVARGRIERSLPCRAEISAEGVIRIQAVP